MSYRIFAVAPSTAGAEPYHRMGYNTARSGAYDPILEVWAGATSATRKVWVDKDGALFLNTAVTSGVGVGNLVLPNASSVRAVDNAGTATVPLILLTSGDVIQVGASANVQLTPAAGFVLIGAPGSTTSAAAGEVVIANNKPIRASNNAGSGTVIIAKLNTSDQIEVGNTTTDAVRTGPLTVATGPLTVTNNGLTVTAGGVAVTAGGVAAAGYTVAHGAQYKSGAALTLKGFAPTPKHADLRHQTAETDTTLAGSFYAEQTIAMSASQTSQAFEAWMASSHNSGTVPGTMGLIGHTEHVGTGTVSETRAGTFSAGQSGAGTITALKHLNIEAGWNTGGGTVTTAYGIYISAVGIGTTKYALYAENSVACDYSATARDTRLLVWDVDTGAIVRVSVGANDSGGTGYKYLRIPN